MDDIQQKFIGGHGRAGSSKTQLDAVAIRALKPDIDLAVIGQTTPFAIGWLYKARSLPARPANIPFRRGSLLASANLTALRIDKADADIKPAFDGRPSDGGVHFFRF
jgi:hypothetical protein